MIQKELSKQQAQAMLDQGITKKDIAARLGVHPNAITKLRLQGGAMHKRRAAARQLKAQHVSNAEIAKRLGVHHGTIWAWVGKDE